MAWWTFRKKTAPRLGPAPVDPRRGWAIHPADPAAFMRALPRLLPPDAVLILENSGHPDVVAALAAYRLTEHPTVPKGTVFPPGRQMYLSVSASQAIAELVEHHPARRVCWHFHAATHERVLVDWHDAFADPCALSEHLSRDAVESFCRELGCTMQ